MEYITSAEINDAFSHQYRHYLTGHLTRPQPYLQHIDDDIEIGMSEYLEFTADLPHVHPHATEHGYVLCGSVKMICYEPEPVEMEFKVGDFFLVRPGIRHISKNAPGTRVLFIKSPGVNDKQLFEPDSEAKEWLTHW